MATLNVCSQEIDSIDAIRFVDESIWSPEEYYLTQIEPTDVGICFIDDTRTYVPGSNILTKQHGLYCIAAIQKAIDLGWLK